MKHVLPAIAAMISFSFLSPALAAPVGSIGNTQSYDPVAEQDGVFMSVIADEANMRAAPRQDSLIQWVYVRAGLPVLVVEQYDNWRKVVDPEGTSGWMRADLLSDRRTAFVMERTRTMFDRPRADANEAYQIEAGNVGTIRICQGAWCRITVGSATGWILRTHLWGTFEGEDFDQ